MGGHTIKNTMTYPSLFGDVGMKHGGSKVSLGSERGISTRHIDVHRKGPSRVHAVGRLDIRLILRRIYPRHDDFPECHVLF